jgi:hypothetical protein
MSPRRLLLLGAVLTALGLSLAMTVPRAGAEGHQRDTTQELAGGIVLLFGWAALGWGIHRFGRASSVSFGGSATAPPKPPSRD